MRSAAGPESGPRVDARRCSACSQERRIWSDRCSAASATLQPSHAYKCLATKVWQGPAAPLNAKTSHRTHLTTSASLARLSPPGRIAEVAPWRSLPTAAVAVERALGLGIRTGTASRLPPPIQPMANRVAVDTRRTHSGTIRSMPTGVAHRFSTRTSTTSCRSGRGRRAHEIRIDERCPPCRPMRRPHPFRSCRTTCLAWSVSCRSRTSPRFVPGDDPYTGC